MTLSFIAFHMRDYQKDTLQLPLEGHGAYFLLLQYCWTHGRIPPDDASKAAICKVPVGRWRRELAPLVAGYFDDNGENKRATAEIAKVEKMRTRKAMAGHNGGMATKRRRAAIASATATATLPATERLPSSGSYSYSAAIKKERSFSLTSTSLDTAREEEAENPPESTPKASLAEPKSVSAMEESRSVFATTDDLKISMVRKGWIA